MRNITVKNVSTAKVYLNVPHSTFNPELMPGRSVPITEEEYRNMLQDNGCRSLIDGHFVKVEGLEDYEQLVPADSVKGVAEIAKMLESLDVTTFAKFIPNATVAEKETVVALAVNRGITHPGFVQLIKKYCDVDIINAINMKHQAEEK